MPLLLFPEGDDKFCFESTFYRKLITKYLDHNEKSLEYPNLLSRGVLLSKVITTFWVFVRSNNVVSMMSLAVDSYKVLKRSDIDTS